MYTIKPLGDEKEILREVNTDAPGKVSAERVIPAPPPPVSMPVQAPVVPMQKQRWWLMILAAATVITNIWLIDYLRFTPSGTSMVLAGMHPFALPIEDSPQGLNHLADYLTLAVAAVQVFLACFILKFRWARIAIIYAAILALCLSVRVWVVGLSQPEGELLWMALNPLALALGTLYGGAHIVPILWSSYIIPITLVVTMLVVLFRDWRKSRNSSGQGQTLQSELSV